MNNHIEPEILKLIQTKPATTLNGKPFDWLVPIQIESLPWKFFGHFIFKKEDLLYRLEKTLAILDSLLISA